MTLRRRLLHEIKTERRIDQFSLAIKPETGLPAIVHDYIVGAMRGEQWLGVPEFLLAHRGPPADALLSLIATLASGEDANAETLPWPKSDADA
jgi:hypothetical protein